MRISLVAAMAENRTIGRYNQLPWHLPADLKHFKAVTMGKPVIMGRKTFESIGKALPGRHNVVVTSDPDFDAPGCTVAQGIDEALAAVAGADEVMVIGGASFYAQMLPHADRLYLTLVHQQVNGDAHFPEFSPSQWRRIEQQRHEPDARHDCAYTFTVWERVTGPSEQQR